MRPCEERREAVIAAINQAITDHIERDEDCTCAEGDGFYCWYRLSDAEQKAVRTAYVADQVLDVLEDFATAPRDWRTDADVNAIYERLVTGDAHNHAENEINATVAFANALDALCAAVARAATGQNEAGVGGWRRAEGSVPYKSGDPMPEVTIRTLRDDCEHGKSPEAPGDG